MAEIFAAVASGAGLVSLSIQLLEGSRKLKELYSNSRDAPDTVDNLCFELETLSLQLRHLERHRQYDHVDTELLDRCITICERRTFRVREVIDQMARYIRRSFGLGRLYTTFKEPEMRKLLEDLEKAKSSLSLAYASYCQSWHMHHTSNHAAALARHGDMLSILQQNSLHTTYLSSLAQTSQPTNDLMAPVARQQDSVREMTIRVSKEYSSVARSHNEDRVQNSKRHLLSLSISLPLWLTRRTWHLAVCESQGSWTIKINPINLRPGEAVVFDYVTRGDAMMVRKLLDAGELSINDRRLSFPFESSIFDLAARLGRVELCDFLLTRYESFRDLIECGFSSFLRQHPEHYATPSVLELMISKYGVRIDVDVNALGNYRSPFYWENFYTTILMHQKNLLDHLPIQERLRLAMHVRSPEDFVLAVGPASWSDLAHCSTSFGETALHWAARRYMRWSDDTEHGESPTKSTEISNLIANLLRAGALPHALSASGQTPLQVLVSHTLFHTHNMIQLENSFNEALRTWGSNLTACELSLSRYAERENELWTSKSLRIGSYSADRQKLTLEGVLVSNDVLAVEFSTRGSMPIWQYQPPPGSFPCHLQDQPIICWTPTDYDGTRTYWREVGTVYTRSRLIRPPAAGRTATLYDATIALEIFHCAQDDHGTVQAAIRRNENLIDRGCAKRRRSSSAPPPGRYTTDDLFHGFDDDIGKPHGYLRQWEIYVSKCPLTATWCLSRRYGHPMETARHCMSGRHGVHGLLYWRRNELLYEFRRNQERERLQRIVEM